MGWFKRKNKKVMDLPPGLDVPPPVNITDDDLNPSISGLSEPDIPFITPNNQNMAANMQLDAAPIPPKEHRETAAPEPLFPELPYAEYVPDEYSDASGLQAFPELPQDIPSEDYSNEDYPNEDYPNEDELRETFAQTNEPELPKPPKQTRMPFEHYGSYGKFPTEDELRETFAQSGHESEKSILSQSSQQQSSQPRQSTREMRFPFEHYGEFPSEDELRETIVPSMSAQYKQPKLNKASVPNFDRLLSEKIPPRLIQHKTTHFITLEQYKFVMHSLSSMKDALQNQVDTVTRMENIHESDGIRYDKIQKDFETMFSNFSKIDDLIFNKN
ncbi:MAG: hypothetical protein ABIG89_04345 [Candidatus Woesearchaeota archaeon]